MMMLVELLRLVLLSLVCVHVLNPARVQALVDIPTFISSNMVLQREPQSAVLWGTADPHTDGTVLVTIDGTESYNSSISSSGTWQVTLSPKQATPPGSQHIITIQGQHNSITLSNILFGDIWLCSGQSNMEFILGVSFGGQQAIQDSAQYTRIRMFTVAKTQSDQPQNNCSSKDPHHLWALSAPDVVGGSWDTEFSAVCYYYGTILHDQLNGQVPIGLLSSNYGGTIIEAWSSPDALRVCESSQSQSPEPTPKSETASFQTMKLFDPTNAQLYNTMIHPLLKMRLMGALWYQGEYNAQHPVQYACQFPAMISDWRVKFNNPKLYFYFVVLAATPTYSAGGDYPATREAQLSALQLPHVGLASAIDLGDPASPHGPIHPRNKHEVGRRLFLAAWDDAYGQDVVSRGPSVTHIDIPGTGSSPDNMTYVIHYTSDATGSGLQLVDTEQCTACCQDQPAYQIKTQLGWINADVVTVSASLYRVSVSSASLSSSNPPIGLRYAWLNYPECVLWNDSKLPALPFNTEYQ